MKSKTRWIIYSIILLLKRKNAFKGESRTVDRLNTQSLNKVQNTQEETKLFSVSRFKGNNSL